MKLQRLAGFGPVAAFVSVGAMLVIGTIQNAPIPPSYFVPAVIVLLLASFAWAGSLTVTLFDLEWLEHPTTHTGLLRFALAAILVAMAMPGAVALIAFAGVGVPIAIAWGLFFAGVGVSLVIHNLEGRRAGLLHGALPWIGIASGAGYVGVGLTQLSLLFTFKLLMGAVYGVPVSNFLYLVWAIWIGVHLVRSKSPARIRTAAATS